MPAAPRTIAIIGGGITGLTAALRARRAGIRVTVFEQGNQPGGCIVSRRRRDWLVEGGPNSLQFGPDVGKLADDVGLGSAVITAAPASQNRFIVRDGRIQPLPSSPLSLLTTSLFSFRARFGIFAEMRLRRLDRPRDVSLSEFVRAHFGQEMVDYALNPFVGGVYAGDPDQLSAKHSFPTLWRIEREHGSLLRGMGAEAKAKRKRGEPRGAPRIVSFAEGLQTLPQAIAAALPEGSIEYGATVSNVIPGREWKVVWSRNGTVDMKSFDAVVLAIPASALAALCFGENDERPLSPLEEQPHPPVASLFLGYRRENVRHPLDGFGALVPARENLSILGVLFSSSLFPGRAPEGRVGLTVFAGGMRQPDIARLSAEDLLKRVAPDLRHLLGVEGEPEFVHHTFWPRAIPQYNLGHERFLEAITRCEAAYPGLFIGGNCRDGISLPDCIRSGNRLAVAAGDYRA